MGVRGWTECRGTIRRIAAVIKSRDTPPHEVRPGRQGGVQFTDIAQDGDAFAGDLTLNSACRSDRDY